MSSTTKHVLREQRIARWALAIFASVVLLIAIPLVLSGALRLRVAQEFGLAPGEGVPQLAGADENVDLLVAPVLKPDPRSDRPARTLVALYIARTSETGVVLQHVNRTGEIRLPIASFDHVAASPDASMVLFVEGDRSPRPRAVLLNVESGTVTPLPAGQRRPDLPGDWDVPLWDNISVRCEAVSPNLSYVACLDPPETAHYLAGDWELRLQRYGDFREQVAVFRGRGLLPVAGWTPDERAILFQNEHGLWRVDVPQAMLASD